MCVAVAAWESLQLLAGRDTHVGSSGKSTPVGALPAQSRAGLWLGLVWSRRRLFIFKLVFKISLYFFFFFNKSVSFLHFRCTASLTYPEGLARLVPYPIWEPPSSGSVLALPQGNTPCRSPGCLPRQAVPLKSLEV